MAAPAGAALVEALVGAVILAIVALAAMSVISGGAGLLRRGAAMSRKAGVLQRALELAHAGQPVPAQIDGLTVVTSVRAVAVGSDIAVVTSSPNPGCQGSCAPPDRMIGGLQRVDVTVTGEPTSITMLGTTFTAP